MKQSSTVPVVAHERPSPPSFPHVPLATVPAVTADEMREIDGLAAEEFGIGLPQMMELAGANLARLAAAVVGELAGHRLAVLVGPGNNGGGGLVAARHLANRGADVHAVLAAPVGRLRPLASDRVATLLQMNVRCCVVPWDLGDGELDRVLTDSDLVIDALLGYAADGAPRGTVAEITARVVASGRPVLSLDLPSGIDPDSGTVLGPSITAATTMTLALPKRGLVSGPGRACAGSLYLADIGLPAALYARAGLAFADPFAGGPIVALD